MKVYFIRHGESVANQKGVMAGQTDMKLTDNGRDQAKAVGAKLRKIPFDAVYSSDLSRAWETCELALGKVPYVKDARLREIDVGELVGLTAEECTKRYGKEHFDGRKRLDFSLYGGENREEFLSRIRSFLAELEGQSYENVAVFSHAGLILSLLEVIWGFAVSGRRIRRPNCMVAVLEYSEGVWRLFGWNI